MEEACLYISAVQIRLYAGQKKADWSCKTSLLFCIARRVSAETGFY